MQIKVNSNQSVETREAMEKWAEAEIRKTLDRFSSEVTRVEIHVGDENAEKGGTGDKRCTMEARLANHQPVAVTEHAPTIDAAFHGAAGKLKRMLDSIVGKMHTHSRDTIRTVADDV
jgi:ribosome-associated translation inhibitor RaiA